MDVDTYFAQPGGACIRNHLATHTDGNQFRPSIKVQRPFQNSPAGLTSFFFTTIPFKHVSLQRYLFIVVMVKFSAALLIAIAISAPALAIPTDKEHVA